MPDILANRWAHNTILAVMMAIVVFAPAGQLPRPGLIAAAFILLAWVLGEHYERLVVVDAGVIDREELREIEREKRGWGFFD
jgi:hypothetical protein